MKTSGLATRKSIEHVRRGLVGLVKRNEFGINGLSAAWLQYVRRTGRRSFRLAGRRVLIADPYWGLNDALEIYWHQIYRFSPSREAPLIIDCGANVGLAVIFFKLAYPKSRVLAFEADPTIFEKLQRNVETFGLQDVTLRNEAVWSSAGTMNFVPDGGVGGRLADAQNDRASIAVPAVTLRPFLFESIDLLKIDIEGAEMEVLRDCEPALQMVRNLFVEYHGAAGQPQELGRLLSMLSEFGFRYYLKETREEHRPLMGDWLRSSFDLQANIFALRDPQQA